MSFIDDVRVRDLVIPLMGFNGDTRIIFVYPKADGSCITTEIGEFRINGNSIQIDIDPSEWRE